MSRTLWFAVGAGAGVYVMTKARRAAETFTPEGLSDRLAALAVGAQMFREELRTGMNEKEIELRARLLTRLHEGQDQDQDQDERRLPAGRPLQLMREGRD